LLIFSDPDSVTKIVNALSLKISPRDLKSKDTRHLLTLIMQQWRYTLARYGASEPVAVYDPHGPA
jgi:hypothetical protein